jgi:hypothetical protein
VEDGTVVLMIWDLNDDGFDVILIVVVVVVVVVVRNP